MAIKSADRIGTGLSALLAGPVPRNRPCVAMWSSRGERVFRNLDSVASAPSSGETCSSLAIDVPSARAPWSCGNSPRPSYKPRVPIFTVCEPQRASCPSACCESRDPPSQEPAVPADLGILVELARS